MQLELTHRFLHRCAALCLGIALTGCAVGSDDPVTPDDEQTATTSADLTTPPAASVPGAVDAQKPAPTVTIVYECSLNGRWWATKPICQANCAGGFCIACGLDCQN